jgi:antirestriction protein ArdC
MPSQTELRKSITQKIIVALEGNILPWRKPWISSENTGRAANVATKHNYSGINPLLLELNAIEHHFQSRWWGTYRQWQEVGCQVKMRPSGVAPGKWGSQIVFYARVTKNVVDPKTGKEEEEEYPILRTFTVFNADQVVGPNSAAYQVREDWDAATARPVFLPAEKLIQATGAEIRHGGDRAFYRRPVPAGSWPHHSGGDFITVPYDSTFVTRENYYETLFHELAHWSEVRLNWVGTYEMGELIAEIASSFLANELRVPQSEKMEHHAAYVKSWLETMRGDHTFIFRAATQASKVADYLLSFAANVEAVTAEAIPF